jgi:hypothetical protein
LQSISIILVRRRFDRNNIGIVFLDLDVVASANEDELLINIHIVSSGINISARMMAVIFLLFLLIQP